MRNTGSVIEEDRNGLTPITIDRETFLRDHCSLPSLPQVIQELQVLVGDANADIERIADLITSDPALLAQVLKVVNSAYYGLPREITKARFAVAFLGFHEVFRLVLSISVIATLGTDNNQALGKFWFHSFYVANCTKYLARKYEQHLSFEELWSAGMLHDIGKLVYMKFFPDHYKAVSRYCEENGCLFTTGENHFDLPKSSFMGTLLCEHWRLPSAVRNACEFHSLSDLASLDVDSKTYGFQRVITLGNQLTILATENLSDEVRQEIGQAARDHLEISEADFLLVMGDIYDLRMEVEKFMSQIR